MEHTGSYKMKIADKAIDFSLKGVDGKTYTLADFKKPILVVFFTCNHCPYAKAYEDRVMKLADAYKAKADVVAINVNDPVKYPQDNFENMVTHAKERKFNFKYLHDQSQETAREYGGLVTPHFFVFDKNRDLVYQGRLDNNWEDASKATKTELKDALDRLSKGLSVRVQVTPVIGCSIKWR